MIFNSFAQLLKYHDRCPKGSVGIRVNPECSTQEEHAIYDPCAPGSRLGVTKANFREDLLPLIDGIHFHTLCEQNADALARTLEAVEEKIRSVSAPGQMAEYGRGPSHHSPGL